MEEYEFYQRIMPIGKLVFVGKAYVPKNMLVYKFPIKKEITAVLSEIPPSSNIEDITYKKVKTITGTIFLADNFLTPKD